MSFSQHPRRPKGISPFPGCYIAASGQHSISLVFDSGYLFPGSHEELYVPSTDVQAQSISKQGSSLKPQCPEVLLGVHHLARLTVHTANLRL